MNSIGRLKILNIWVDPVTKAEAVRRVRHYLQAGSQPYSIFASNPEKNFSVPKDPILYDTFKNADLLLPDGIGVVLAARILYGAKLERVPGSEFIFDICNIAKEEGFRIFVYGAREDVNQKAVEKLKIKYPALQIVGRSNGYVSEPDMPLLIDRINRSKADILFLALGSPMQEKWYAANRGFLHHVKVCQGIGGTLDTIAGNVKRAPQVWRKLSLEWFYRLITEPKRVSRQKVLPVFTVLVLLSKLKNLVKN